MLAPAVVCAGKLPAEALDLCEVEPLRQEDPGSAVWVPDELQVRFVCTPQHFQWTACKVHDSNMASCWGLCPRAKRWDISLSFDAGFCICAAWRASHGAGGSL
jgi:hypothetical protein